MTRFRLTVAAVGLLLAAGAAPAQLKFTFAQGGNDLTGTQNWTVGTPISFQVFLVSTNDTRFDNRDLFSVGTRVTTTGGFGSFDQITRNSDPAVWVRSTRDLSTGRLQVFDDQDIANDGDVDDLQPFGRTDRVMLGTFTVTPTAPGAFTLTAGDYDPLTDDSIAQTQFELPTNAVVLDPSITAGTLSVNISPVPEPAFLLAVAAGGALVARRRACRAG